VAVTRTNLGVLFQTFALYHKKVWYSIWRDYWFVDYFTNKL